MRNRWIPEEQGLASREGVLLGIVLVAGLKGSPSSCVCVGHLCQAGGSYWDKAVKKRNLAALKAPSRRRLGHLRPGKFVKQDSRMEGHQSVPSGHPLAPQSPDSKDSSWHHSSPSSSADTKGEISCLNIFTKTKGQP